MKQVQTKTKGLSSVMGKLGGAISTAFAVTAVIGFGKEITKTGMAFESQMSKVKAISGATAEELAKMEEEARRLGSSTMFSASDAGKGLEYFAMAGWSVNDSITALEPTLRLAQASGEELGITADIVSDAITAFGLKASDTSGFADLLASTSSNANTNVSMLGESFKYVAPLIGSVGGSAEHTALALGLMANAGIKGSQAGTALKSAITNMLNPTETMAKAMTDFGVDAQFAEDGSLNLKTTLDNLRTSFAELTPEQQAQASSTIFGKEAMSGMLAIINASEEDYKKLTNATTEYNGVATEMAKTMEDNLQGKIANLKSAWEELQLVLYEKLVPILKIVVEWITKLVQWISDLESNLKSTFKSNSDTLKKFTDFFEGIKERVVTIIQTIINKGTEWYTNNKEVIDQIKESFKGFAMVVGEVINLALDIINLFIEQFSGFFLDNATNIILEFVEVFKGIAGIIKGVLTIIKGIFEGDWAMIWEGFKQIFESAWGTIVGILIREKERIREKAEAIAQVFVDIFENLDEKALEWGKDIVRGLINGISSQIEKAKKKASEFAEGVGTTVKDFFGIASPSKLMISYGRFITEGLALGIENNQGRPTEAINHVAEVVDNAFQKVNTTVKNTVGIIQKEFQLWQLQNEELKGSSKALEIQLEAQKNEHDILSQQVDVAKSALERITATYGETSEQAMNYKNVLLDLQIQQQSLKNSIDETTASLKSQSSVSINYDSFKGSSSSSRKKRKKKYEDNKDEINEIANKHGVDVGVAQDMWNSNKVNEILGKVPKYAKGGIVTKPTLAMIGEGGESEAVIPLSKLETMGFGGSVNGLVVNVYGSVGVDDIGETNCSNVKKKGCDVFCLI